MILQNNWKQILDSEFKKQYYKDLCEFLNQDKKNFIIYPQEHEIFNALQLTDYDKVRVVIIGQDPYHNQNQAHGLCFSVRKAIPLPPSLRNIYKEIENDLNIKMSSCGDLTNWAKQGVLLLNTVLTVRNGDANSHRNIGWQQFTDAIIKALNNKKTPIIYLLWGTHAQSKTRIIDKKHHILSSSHPSPLSAYRGFFGCKHFSRTNEILTSMNEKQIKWEL